MRHAELKVLSGKQSGSKIPLPEGKFLVGREVDCHLRPNSDLISRHHCVFTVDEYAVRLRDLGSTNGTLVNGERIRGGVMLNPGDVVSIGKIELQVMIREPDGDTGTHKAFNMDTQTTGIPVLPSPEAADQITSELPANIAESDTTVQLSAPASDAAALPAAPSSDTQFMNTMGMPGQQQMGYPPQMPMGYPPQMMPPQYGYPGYPGMYPQQMGYPMPGMYPQQMPGYEQQPAQSAPAATETIQIPVKLPDPEQTGAKPPEPPKPAQPGAQTAEAKAKAEAPNSAAAIIDQYRNRRPGS